MFDAIITKVIFYLLKTIFEEATSHRLWYY